MLDVIEKNSLFFRGMNIIRTLAYIFRPLMKRLFHILFVLLLCAATTEWISIEEILGKRDAEITAEGDSESSESLREKERESGGKQFDFQPVLVQECIITLLPAFRWVEVSECTIVQDKKTALIPLYLLHCQLKVYS